MVQNSSSTAIAFLILTIMFAILVLIKINLFDIGSYFIYYFIPTLKMTRDLNNESKCRKWVYYYAGIAFLTIFYYIFGSTIYKSYILVFLLSFPLTFRDGALIAFFARSMLSPIYLSLTSNVYFKKLSKSVSNIFSSLSKSLKLLFPFF